MCWLTRKYFPLKTVYETQSSKITQCLATSGWPPNTPVPEREKYGPLFGHAQDGLIVVKIGPDAHMSVEEASAFLKSLPRRFFGPEAYCLGEVVQVEQFWYHTQSQAKYTTPNGDNADNFRCVGHRNGGLYLFEEKERMLHCVGTGSTPFHYSIPIDRVNHELEMMGISISKFSPTNARHPLEHVPPQIDGVEWVMVDLLYPMKTNINNYYLDFTMRLFKSNVVKCVFRKPSVSRPLPRQLNSFRQKSNSCGSSFFKQVDAKQLSGGMRQSFFGIPCQMSSVRPYHKLRVTDLPEDATEESVRQHFSPFGMLLSVNFVTNTETKKSEGEAYVVFADKKALDSAMDSQPHVICNKPVSICLSDEISFVLYRLSPLTTNKSLHDYFSSYGKVLRCEMIGVTGFVHFSALDEVDKELASRVHEIDGKEVEVIFMPPKELTLYVGNLSPSTTDQLLHAFYSQFGNLLKAEVKLDRSTGKSRGFGFVSFSSHQELDSALRSAPHIIDGNEVRTNYRMEAFSLLVAGLSPNMSENQLRKYFERFGPVHNCRIARDKETDQLLHHGWVVFSSQQGLNDALLARPHLIDGQFISTQASKKQARVATLFIGGLSSRTTHQMLHDLFSKFGTVVRSEVKLDRMTGRPRGFGYVTYSSTDEGSKALLGGPHEVDGRVLTVELSDGFKTAKSAASSGYAAKKNYALQKSSVN